MLFKCYSSVIQEFSRISSVILKQVLFKWYSSVIQVLFKCYSSVIQVLFKCYFKWYFKTDEVILLVTNLNEIIYQGSGMISNYQDK